jgi:cytochrome P450 family 135
MLRAQRELRDGFTVKIGTEPPAVMLAHPDAVREVFKGDPAILHAGKANVILRPLGSASAAPTPARRGVAPARGSP